MGCSSDCCGSQVITNENTQRNNRYPAGITKNQFPTIESQMIKYVCKIYQTEEATATGFMCKISYQNQLLPVLITNNHVLNEEKIKIGQTIRFSFNDNQIEKTIKIDNSRKKYTNPMKDVTVVEIKEEEDKIDDFLDIDDKDNIRNEDEYKDKGIYILQYQLDHNCSFSQGIIIYR